MKQVTIIAVAAVVALLLGIAIGLHYNTSVSTTTQTYTTISTTSANTASSTLYSTIITSVQTSTANPTTTVPTPSYTIRLENNASIGFHLVNATKFTLYLNSQDKQNGGTSVCYGQCEVYWKPFYTSNLTLQPNLSVSDFGTITRVGGAKQLTYKGYPLYYYTGDTAPGQLNGQGVAGIWLVVTYPNLTT